MDFTPHIVSILFLFDMDYPTATVPVKPDTGTELTFVSDAMSTGVL
jgi:hypothetical protein